MKQAAAPYEHPWDHLADELRRLDVWIEAGMRSMTVHAEDPALDPFRGLVVTDSEAAQLLADDGRYAVPDEDQLQELHRLETLIASRVSSSKERGMTLPLHRLQEAFRLDEWDIRCLIAILAPDLDRRYEKLYAYLQDDMTSKFATVDLLLRLWCLSERDRRHVHSRLQPYSPLYAMLRSERDQADNGAARSVLSRPLRADERIVSFVQGFEWNYTGSMSGVRRYRHDGDIAPLDTEDAAQIRLQRHLRDNADHTGPLVYMMHGPTGGGKTLQSRHAAASAGRDLLEWDMAKAPADEAAFRDTAVFVLREARMLHAVPVFAGLHEMAADPPDRRLTALTELLADWQGPVFLHAETSWTPDRPIRDAVWIDIPFRLPDLAARQRIWMRAAGAEFAVTDKDGAALAAKFRFTPGRVEQTVRTARQMQQWESGTGGAHLPYEARLLHRAGYMQVKHRMSEKAVKLEPKFGWEDLILPDETKSLLRQACNRLLHRHLVYGQWGFERKLAYGKGLSMMFTGPPGTGKTMSALVMAREMDAELYRIDLSRIVSKYIGETEKNLSDIFDEAQLSGAILFFDEADALFGKRSEVKDAHDKYANMETSYLLQKMEEYEGLTILATNFAQNLDEAFTRRIQYIVKYPFPDPVQREQLWRSTLPKELPAEGDIDYAYLAQTFDLAGGSIKNVVLTAAFLAADEGGGLSMKHMIEAVKQEYKKAGKVLLKDRLGAYSD